METEKSQPEGKRKMPGTRFNEFPALSVDPRVEISRSASETGLISFPTYDIEKYYLSFLLFFDILCRITILFERHSVHK